MSLDIVVWLSCTVVLPSALPQPEAWWYSKITHEQLTLFPKELAARLEGFEDWQLTRPTYLINASYAKKDQFLTLEQLHEMVPQIETHVQSIPSDAETRGAEDKRRQDVLAERARSAPIGVSLVLQGATRASSNEQNFIAAHLAKNCGGAVLETPAGFIEIDKGGKALD